MGDGSVGGGSVGGGAVGGGSFVDGGGAQSLRLNFSYLEGKSNF